MEAATSGEKRSFFNEDTEAMQTDGDSVVDSSIGVSAMSEGNYDHDFEDSIVNSRGEGGVGIIYSNAPSSSTQHPPALRVTSSYNADGSLNIDAEVFRPSFLESSDVAPADEEIAGPSNLSEIWPIPEATASTRPNVGETGDLSEPRRPVSPARPPRYSDIRQRETRDPDGVVSQWGDPANNPIQPSEAEYGKGKGKRHDQTSRPYNVWGRRSYSNWNWNDSSWWQQRWWQRDWR